MIMVDNIGAAFALIKATSDSRTLKSLVEAEAILVGDEARHISYVFSERNIADCLTRKELLDAMLEQFDPEMILIEFEDLLPPAELFLDSFFAPFEAQIEEALLVKAKKRKRKQEEEKGMRKKKKCVET